MSARLQFSFARPPRSAPYLVTVTMPCLVLGTFLPSSLSTASYVIVTCPMYYKVLIPTLVDPKRLDNPEFNTDGNALEAKLIRVLQWPTTGVYC